MPAAGIPRCFRSQAMTVTPVGGLHRRQLTRNPTHGVQVLQGVGCAQVRRGAVVGEPQVATDGPSLCTRLPMARRWHRVPNHISNALREPTGPGAAGKRARRVRRAQAWHPGAIRSRAVSAAAEDRGRHQAHRLLLVHAQKAPANIRQHRCMGGELGRGHRRCTMKQGTLPVSQKLR